MDPKGQVSRQTISWPRSKERRIQPGYECIVGETYPYFGVTTGTQLVLDRCQGRISAGTSAHALLSIPQGIHGSIRRPRSQLQERKTLLLRVFPGQRDAALLWSDHFAGTLKQQNFDRCIACPTLFRDDRNSILVAHVDDIQAAGNSSNLEPKLSRLGETYELKVEGPFLTEQELAVGDSHQGNSAITIMSFTSLVTRST